MTYVEPEFYSIEIEGIETWGDVKACRHFCLMDEAACCICSKARWQKMCWVCPQGEPG